MLIINLFGAPGAGKSTGAAYVFSQLKAAGVNAELVTEFAKDKVWEGTKAVSRIRHTSLASSISASAGLRARSMW